MASSKDSLAISGGKAACGGVLLFVMQGTLGGAAQKGKGGVDFLLQRSYPFVMIPTPTIVRSSKRRRTVALHVEDDGSLTVQAPLRVSLGWIEAFIREKARWIERRRRIQVERKAAPKLRLTEGNTIPYLGRDLRLALAETGATTLCEESGTLTLPLPRNLPPELLHDEIKTELTLWYKRQARRVFAERMDHWATQMGLRPARLSVTAPAKRWGSCSAKDDIRLNWRLILTTPDVLDYVIVHELAHIPHKNHGKRFWRLVERFIPDSKIKRQQLRKYEKSPFYTLFA